MTSKLTKVSGRSLLDGFQSCFRVSFACLHMLLRVCQAFKVHDAVPWG